MSDLRRGMARMVGIGAAVLTVCVFAITAVASQDEPFPVPDSTHKCPVCGMVVHRYPDFLASVTYADGHTVYFDGAKDMFKYLFDLDRYDPNRRVEQIRRIRVTEYYDMVPMDAREAFYVVGSDVFGPMGHELIPLRTQADAREFKNDHHGRRILTFQQVKPATISRLD
ncbi:nitrous oxide reductase accessory protein NosL [Desulfosarcina ovata]|uniref:Nitrous oxide reductase accessory protein NosL n=1 Tax=Desulfosarcina ovata subsp. ovata TaxID=2752305 RepID=A0A5K8AM01_9BACT|nr:nitrous oxide reductase accessory protein NosL [Desulfosarcina ovata]BBO92654.1 hypothetical protein DSCOOX_58340 [Desulfosarcina ovata subsp. ovata]